MKCQKLSIHWQITTRSDIWWKVSCLVIDCPSEIEPIITHRWLVINSHERWISLWTVSGKTRIRCGKFYKLILTFDVLTGVPLDEGYYHLGNGKSLFTSSIANNNQFNRKIIELRCLKIKKKYFQCVIVN